MNWEAPQEPVSGDSNKKDDPSSQVMDYIPSTKAYRPL